MAYDRVVDSAVLDSYLTSIASSIRSKTGKMTTLSFPAGFVDAINAIPVGGGPGGLQGYKILTGSFTETYDQNGVYRVQGATAPFDADSQGFLLWIANNPNTTQGAQWVALVAAYRTVGGQSQARTTGAVISAAYYDTTSKLSNLKMPNGHSVNSVEFDLSGSGARIAGGQTYNWVYVYKE